MAIELNITPTLIIMEGSTAGKIGNRIKSQILANYGDIPVVRFLWIDTDVKIPEGAGEWITPRERAELVGYDANVVLQHLDDYPTIKNWWPKDTHVRAGVISKGAAQQMRLIGRLSLFRQFDEAVNGQQSFRSKLQQAAESIHEIENIAATRDMSNDKIRFEVDQNGTRVIFIFSTCGGTGSAISFDIAYLCRHLLRGHYPKLMAFSILPPVIDKEIRDESQLQRQKIRANTYAWFKEDQYLMENPNWYVRYPTFSSMDIASIPFDAHFVVDLINEGNNRLNSADDIYKMIAQSIFLDTGTAIAGENSSFLTNVGVLDHYFKDRRQAYSSIASASIVFPSKRLLDYCGHKFALQMIDQGILGTCDSTLVESTAASTCADLNLSEDALIRSLMEGRGVQFLKRNAIQRSETVQHTLNLLTEQKTDADTAVDMQIKEMAIVEASLEQTAKVELENAIAQMLLINGIRNATEMINTLTGSLAEIQERYAQQSETRHLGSLENFENALKKLDKMDEDLHAAQRIIARNKWAENFNQQKQDCLTSLEQLIISKLTQAAMKQADNLCSKLMAFLKEKTTELKAIAQSTELVWSNLKERLADLGEPKVASEGVFELNREVLGDKAYFESYYAENATALTPATVYQSYSGKLNYHSLSNLKEWAENILQKDLLESAKAQFIDGIEETSLLDAVQQHYGTSAPAQIRRMMEQLLAYCQPFWQYERDWGRHFQEGKSIIGVEDKHNQLIPDEFRQDMRYNMVSTGFKHRIDVVRFKHGLPAFLLHGMKDYQVAYDEVRKNTKDPLHILPNMREIEDIFPDEHKKRRHVFALGLVFNFIVQSASWYYIDLDRGYTSENHIKPSRNDQLSQGRSNAEEALIHMPEVCDTISNKVESIVQDMGNKAAIEILRKAILDLNIHKGKLSPENEEMYSQLDHEIQYLEDYIVNNLGGTLEK
jgi:hypothetical protein